MAATATTRSGAATATTTSPPAASTTRCGRGGPQHDLGAAATTRSTATTATTTSPAPVAKHAVRRRRQRSVERRRRLPRPGRWRHRQRHEVGQHRRQRHVGGSRSDTVQSYGGNDFLYGGGTGNSNSGSVNTLWGGAGDDWYYIGRNDGFNTIADGQGDDNLVLIGQFAMSATTCSSRKRASATDWRPGAAQRRLRGWAPTVGDGVEHDAAAQQRMVHLPFAAGRAASTSTSARSRRSRSGTTTSRRPVTRRKSITGPAARSPSITT